MKLILEKLAFEVTRRCNERCAHCMRGESQNIDLTKETIDRVFDTNPFLSIKEICFSGGEPTLNKEVIIYTIDKIIKENIDVSRIVMITNGQIFNKDLVDALNRFNEYRNNRFLESIPENLFGSASLNFILKTNLNNNVHITFSDDTFHSPLNQDVISSYMIYGSNLNFRQTGDLAEKEIHKTGFSTIGSEFYYHLLPLYYYYNGSAYQLLDNFYITANGNVTNLGDGSYQDMDKINMGNIHDMTLVEIIAKYGIPRLGAPKIEIDEIKKEKKMNYSMNK